MPPQYKAGDTVTVIDKQNANAYVIQITKVGWKYLYHEYDQLRIDDDRYIILPGERLDIRNRLQALRREYTAAWSAYQDRRYHALKILEREWDEANPPPQNEAYTYVQELGDIPNAVIEPLAR